MHGCTYHAKCAGDSDYRVDHTVCVVLLDVTRRCGALLEKASLIASRINILLNQIDTNHYFGVKCEWLFRVAMRS